MGYLCSKCKLSLGNGKSVLFICDCEVQLCNQCCVRRLATDPKSYHAGVTCPVCKKESDNVRGKTTALREENKLVVGAFRRLLDREISSTYELVEDDYISAFKALNEKLVHDNDMKDLFEHAQELILQDPVNLGSLRMKLCLARVESVLQSGVKAKIGEFVPGPLRHIFFRRNLHLEELIEKNREIESMKKVEKSDNGDDSYSDYGSGSSSHNDTKESLSQSSLVSPVSPIISKNTGETAVGDQGGDGSMHMIRSFVRSDPVVIEFLRATKEQVRQSMKKSNEQFRQLSERLADDFGTILSKIEEQNKKLCSIERKLDERAHASQPLRQLTSSQQSSWNSDKDNDVDSVVTVDENDLAVMEPDERGVPMNEVARSFESRDSEEGRCMQPAVIPNRKRSHTSSIQRPDETLRVSNYVECEMLSAAYPHGDKKRHRRVGNTPKLHRPNGMANGFDRMKMCSYDGCKNLFSIVSRESQGKYCDVHKVATSGNRFGNHEASQSKMNGTERSICILEEYKYDDMNDIIEESSNTSSRGEQKKSVRKVPRHDSTRQADQQSDKNHNDTKADDKNPIGLSLIKRCSYNGCTKSFSIRYPSSQRKYCDQHRKHGKLKNTQTSKMQPRKEIQCADKTKKYFENQQSDDFLFDNAHDDVCHVCGSGGELLLCDFCSLSFHSSCADLDKVPVELFKCPVCIQDQIPNIWPWENTPVVACCEEGCREIFVATNDGTFNKEYCDAHSKSKRVFKFLGKIEGSM